MSMYGTEGSGEHGAVVVLYSGDAADMLGSNKEMFLVWGMGGKSGYICVWYVEVGLERGKSKRGCLLFIILFSGKHDPDMQCDAICLYTCVHLDSLRRTFYEAYIVLPGSCSLSSR